MNLWWEVFGVAENALGGWIANAARLATIILAILLTIYKDRLWKSGVGEVDWASGEPQLLRNPSRRPKII